MLRALLAIVCLLPITALAQKWVAIANTATSNHYLDVESLRKEGNKVVAWLMQDEFTDKPGGKYPNLRSRSLQIVADCPNMEMGIRQFSLFSGQMGGGEVLDSSSVVRGKEVLEESRPGSLGRAWTKAACDLSSGARKASDYDQIIANGEGLIILLLAEKTADLGPHWTATTQVNRYSLPTNADRPWKSREMEWLVDCKARRVARSDMPTWNYSEWHGMGDLVDVEGSEPTEKERKLSFPFGYLPKVMAAVCPKVGAKK